MTASLVTNSGRSTWFVGVLVLMVNSIFAMTFLSSHRKPADFTAMNSTGNRPP